MKQPDFKPVPRQEPDPHYLGKLENVIKSYWKADALCNYGGKQYSYEELAVNVEKIHLLLEAAGVKKATK